ncbi:MAG: site-specific integrase, partial [Actinomycetota bacterium]|nr:site-specific integrase [Actinomycetota bacterium]
RQTLGVIDHRLLFSTPKTRMSARRFRVDPVTIEALREHRRRQYDERVGWGPAWHNSGDLVFTREDGSPVHPNWLIRRFMRIARRTGLPPIRFHDLRHTYATLALQAGVSVKVVSTRLGHASIGITLDTYSHVLPDDDEEAALLFHRHVYGAVSKSVSKWPLRGPTGPAMGEGQSQHEAADLG